MAVISNDLYPWVGISDPTDVDVGVIFLLWVRSAPVPRIGERRFYFLPVSDLRIYENLDFNGFNPPGLYLNSRQPQCFGPGQQYPPSPLLKSHTVILDDIHLTHQSGSALRCSNL
jgi:hypothetical protein